MPFMVGSIETVKAAGGGGMGGYEDGGLGGSATTGLDGRVSLTW